MIFLYSRSTTDPLKRPIKAFILSAYYYPYSKSLGKDAFALVMSINLGKRKSSYQRLQVGDLTDTTEISVLGRNKSSGVLVRTNYERITLHENCQMISIFATVQLLPNTLKVSMESNGVVTEIPFKIPSYKKRDVVVCISPLYVSEQWQNFLLAAHIYKQFGAHLHVYFISAVASFFQLMHEYEKHNYITMQPWDRVYFPHVTGDIADVYQQMEFQNLAAAQTDCLLQYKESAKFITLFDLNDILIPTLAPTLVEEFQILMSGQSHVSYMIYPRQNYEATVYNKTGFSIQSMMNSLVDKNTRQTGRIVINPHKLNYTYINRPLCIPNGSRSMDVTSNFITHLDSVVWENNELAEASLEFFNLDNSTDNMYKVFFGDIEEDLKRMLKKQQIAEILGTLPNFYYFYDLVNKCFEEKYYRFINQDTINSVKNDCPGPQMCGFYQHPRIECVHVNATHIFMEPIEPITYYYATEHHYTADIGCYAQ
ncbi:hypothetical protein GCK72_020494 [Caenorhabditis remanei]|uniref:Glycosyltransferase family 92 protein n=1 Tax=Caenorhabditis remanei TaxID=31234 RepID=A0A6A5GFC6_CAERE|nr:hypothetical protein GCK72_020494 [Caenorhabditis remanei]KAF1753937.1 hypothetical protein GCK72_020494 [Caenorhabditis remanei]